MKIETTDDSMIVNGKQVKFFSDHNPLNCPWKDWGVDLVLESTGVFNADEKASMHIQAGAKKVILTAPGKGPKVGTFVVGVNEASTAEAGTSSATPAAPPTAWLRWSR